VIHPRFFVYGGGELLSLYVMKTLLESGYEVELLADTCDPVQAERMYGLGRVLKSVKWLTIPEFKPAIGRLLAFQRLFYAREIGKLVEESNAELAFSTQSSIFPFNKGRLYHYLYDIIDLFHYPSGIVKKMGASRSIEAYYWNLRIAKRLMIGNPKVSRFFGLSQSVVDELEQRGYENTELVYPPCPLEFKPRSSKNPIVIQATRIVPQKRLELFFEVAKRLPHVSFLLVARDNPILRSLNPDYSSRLLKSRPENVRYVEAGLREVPELLESAKVYLYTGIEPGIGIALCQAIGAGCIPVSPSEGGGGEVVKTVTDNGYAGFTFDSVDEAVEKVKSALGANVNPYRQAEGANPFSPESFCEKVKSLL